MRCQILPPKLLHYLRWSAALVVAGVFSAHQPRVALGKFRKALALWFSGRQTEGLASEELTMQRLAVCRACPLWYGRLETCGTPLTKALRPYGCKCFLPAKARLAEAQCWLDEELGDEAPHGWRKSGLANPKIVI